VKKLSIFVVLIVTLALTASVMANPPEHKFVGEAKCKMCHKIQDTSWAATKHAKAFDALKPNEQKDAKCFGCHVTNNDPAMPGVQCEACHGGGGDYMTMKVMKDPAAAKAAGLVKPDKAACEKCHNKQSPTFKGFNFEEAVKKVHDHKPKA
jgi:Cytochrome c554 and c-prime